MEKIELNGKSYVLEESIKKTSKKELDGFKFKEYKHYLTKLEKMFSFTQEPLDFQTALSYEKLSVLDSANVLMVIAKTDRAKDLLRNFIWRDDFDEERNTKNASIKLEFKAKEDEIFQSKYSNEYLVRMIDFFNFDEDESVKLSSGHNYPLKLFNCDWEMILAPRVDNND